MIWLVALFKLILLLAISGCVKEKKVHTDAIRLPDIPTISESATDLGVYNRDKLQDHSKFSQLPQQKQLVYHSNFLRELYQVTYGEEISDDTLNIFVDRLDQGASRAGIYRFLVAQKEYVELERGTGVVNDELVQFAQKYSTLFLGNPLNTRLIRTFNKEKLKRLIIERTLLTLSKLQTKPQDLHSWYAVFSAKMANALEWKNQHRAKPLADFHYHWARSAPLDHVISEVIIKLSRLVDSFN